MRRYISWLAMLSLSLAIHGIHHAATGNDQQIAEQIVQKLQAEKQSGALKGFNIDLQVDEGTVWLSGNVSTAEQQSKALDVARRISGVVQVVNDLVVTPPQAAAPAAPRTLLAALGQSIIGSGVAPSAASATRSTVVQAAEPIANLPMASSSPSTSPGPQALMPEPLATANLPVPNGPVANAHLPPAASLQPIATANLPQAAPPQPIAMGAAPPAMMVQPMPFAVPVPVYAGTHSQVPLPFAPSQTVNYNGAAEGMPGAPMPMHLPGSGVGIAPARYDHPTMPGYAWPSYAAYPNYAAVTYPKQYSPAAWPYIGPFYPYPQVPLGWRKVTLEWDDGWWMLDFKDRRSMYNH